MVINDGHLLILSNPGLSWAWWWRKVRRPGNTAFGSRVSKAGNLVSHGWSCQALFLGRFCGCPSSHCYRRADRGLCLWTSDGSNKGSPLEASVIIVRMGGDRQLRLGGLVVRLACLSPGRAWGPCLAEDSGLLICRHSASPSASRSEKSSLDT